MLPKQYRLTKDKDFERVAKQGLPYFTRELGMKVAENNLAVSRFGIVVSLKVSKKAILRNKVKRRIREIIRLKLAEIRSGYDVMILTNSTTLELNYRQLEEKLTQLFQKAGLSLTQKA